MPAACPALPFLTEPAALRLILFAGKGGVGKTTCAAATALGLAAAEPTQQFLIVSVDPAHSLRDAFADEPPPSGARPERWRRIAPRVRSIKSTWSG